MGSPLVCVLASLFMGYHEKKWLQEFDKRKVLMYKHYVDEIFSMFGNQKDVEKFSESFNCQHKNIKFTIEKESNKYLSLLDILTKNEGNRFSTSVFLNKTSIELKTIYLPWIITNEYDNFKNLKILKAKLFVSIHTFKAMLLGYVTLLRLCYIFICYYQLDCLDSLIVLHQ